MKKVLVYGLGRTGISAVKTLSDLAYRVYTYDKNKQRIDQLEGYDYSPISESEILDKDYDFVVKSPGIHPKDKILVSLAEKYEIISDIELSFRLFPNRKIIAITGTNGKTSTTSMITHILNESKVKALSVGNIGEGILYPMYKNPKAVFVSELSSFQLKNVKNYHPHIASILNITQDHIDWHGSFKDYIESKLNISKNQNKADYLIINADDKILKAHKKDFKVRLYEFSSSKEVDRGAFIKDGAIYLRDDKSYKLAHLDDLTFIGRHNYENIMVALLAAYLYGIKIDDIRRSIKTFRSIEHRLEYVDTIKGLRVYNDSKATNVDSSLKALASFDEDIILIAGGYDKKIDYEDFVKAFKKNGKLMILMGQTKDILKNLCEKYKIEYLLAQDMKEAVGLAFENASKGSILLLSPASASWGMYDNFEQRGDDFKKKVREFKDK
ncbi:MAG: UDP-N-acetylmuramoyl-L-alanine--D-glutamate ligase [Anaerococcus sp.]|nr:UDP-N-acetylmuramoyl-L-alanine--D-glutamate ligase [Anaerococcus sp.]